MPCFVLFEPMREQCPNCRAYDTNVSNDPRYFKCRHCRNVSSLIGQMKESEEYNLIRGGQVT